MVRCSDIDGKFSEICAVFHLAQPWQAFISIFSVRQRYVVQLKLHSL